MMNDKDLDALEKRLRSTHPNEDNADWCHEAADTIAALREAQDTLAGALVEAADRLKWQLAGFEADLDDTDATGMVNDYLGHVVPAAREFEAALARLKGLTP
jgi:hypothetical protein